MAGMRDSERTDLLVIGAGLPRTGTLSLMHALEIILPGKCHHMIKAMDFDEEWGKIFNGEMSDEQFRNFFASNNEVAAVDAPFCFVYERAMRIYPNAKVILTIREAESWVKSVKATVFKRRPLDPTFCFMMLGLFPSYLSDPRKPLKSWPKHLFSTAEGAAAQKAIMNNGGIEYFNNWTREVEAKVPKERLLKFSVKEGWAPLCKFLGVEQPDVDFPRVNSSDEFSDAKDVPYRRAWLIVYELVTIPLCVYMLYRISRQA